MRARLALAVSGPEVEHREVVLRDKPQEMLDVSPKGTVPVLVLPDGKVVDESEDVMLWALRQHDPQSWLAPETESLEAMRELVRRTEDEFKSHLDRYKYSNRYEGADSEEHRDIASNFLRELDSRLRESSYLFGERLAFADAAIAPFVRQFANTDRGFFDEQAWPALRRWLEEFLASELFVGVMGKHAQWVAAASSDAT
jgi:glutathione S-transferase